MQIVRDNIKNTPLEYNYMNFDQDNNTPTSNTFTAITGAVRSAIQSSSAGLKPYLNNKVNPNSFKDTRLYRNRFVEVEQPTLLDEIIKDTNASNAASAAREYYEAGVNDILPNVRKSYVRVDSRQRLLYPTNVYDDQIYYLDAFPLSFENKSTKVTISIRSHPLQQNDRITLRNVVSKSVLLRNPLSVKKNSLYVQIYQKNHGLSLFGLYNPLDSDEFISVNEVASLPMDYRPDQIIPDGLQQYYVCRRNLTLDFFIQLGNVKGTITGSGFIGNIPVNFLNKRHRALLLFTKSGVAFVANPDVFLIALEKKSSINYRDGIVNDNSVTVTFYMLYGIPLDYLNADLPISEKNKYPYFSIESVTANTIMIDCGYNAIVDPDISFYSDTDNLDVRSLDLMNSNRGGGPQCFIQHILRVLPAYPNPNTYQFTLDRTYRAVSQVNLISSEFPNSQVIITDYPEDQTNNRLYWQNLNDGDPIYFISVTPGNYSISSLITEVEYQANKLIRYEYTTNAINGIIPYISDSIPSSVVPIEPIQRYDLNGNYKYNIIRMTVDESTSIVSFSSFNRVLLQDDECNQVIYIPDNIMILTQHENLTIKNESRELYTPLLIPNDVFLIYFTEQTASTIRRYPYAYGNVYRFIELIYSNKRTRTDQYRVQLENDIALLVNFYKTTPTPHQEINSINTSTLLENFNYNFVENQVVLPDHNLKIGDVILSDQLNDMITPNVLYAYEISEIINDNMFAVIRYDIGSKYKFIYDDLLVNFFDPSHSSPNYVPLTKYNQGIIQVETLSENKKIVQVNQPNHTLSIGDIIVIQDSGSINRVPANVINGSHEVYRIIDDNSYEFVIDSYTPTANNTNSYYTMDNIVTITYPNIFRMYFNFTDTLGDMLSFFKVGQDIAISPFVHRVYNYMPYEVDYDLESLGNDYIQRLKKLFMTGENYFYIVCPQIGFYNNTLPVENVFATIRWLENPNFIVFDTFVPIVYTYDKPISVLNQLTFSFNNYNGSLVNFNGLDHSFTLEIIELFNVPPETNIDARLEAQVIQSTN
jgi:hypothetical protein